MQRDKPAKKPTINDVAKLAGTGKTSVSRYLNGELSVLSDTLQARIAQAIKQLDYRPNKMARSLKRGQTKLIALILADITNPYSIEMMNGLEAACQKQGYTLLVCNTQNEAEKERYYLQLLIDYNVDGVVIHALQAKGTLFTQLPFPMVLVDRKLNAVNIDLVGLDNVQATELAVAHLIESGFSALLFVSEPIKGVSTREERTQTFKRVIKRHKAINGQVLEVAHRAEDSLDQSLLAFCQKNAGLRKAVLTANSQVTLFTSLSMKRLNLNWGRDIGLLGFDDPSWAELVGVGISAIRQPTQQIGQSAFELLLCRIQGDRSPAKTILYPAELIIRESTHYR